MPLSATDWTAEGRDPQAFLTVWSEAVVDALHAQLSGHERLVAEVDRTRAAADAVAPPDATPGTPPTLVAPARFTDRRGATVTDGGRLAAAVLFVTPDNKADSDASLAFAVRAAALVTAGVVVVIVDALPGPPSWATHLHSLVGVYPLPRRPRNGEAPVLVVQPRIEGGAGQYAVWHFGVAAGFPLPTVPVPVAGAPHLKLDLEAAYLDACKRSRPA